MSTTASELKYFKGCETIEQINKQFAMLKAMFGSDAKEVEMIKKEFAALPIQIRDDVDRYGSDDDDGDDNGGNL
jgi:hypothetical protein